MKTELIYKQIDKPINVNIDNTPIYCQNENVEDWIELKKDSFSHYGYIKKNYDNTWYYIISVIVAPIPTTIHLPELIELTAKIKECEGMSYMVGRGNNYLGYVSKNGFTPFTDKRITLTTDDLFAISTKIKQLNEK